MEEVEARVASFLATGSREQRAWLEAWAASPATWSRLPSMLKGRPISAAALPWVGAAAARSCSQAGAPPGWGVQLARLLLAWPEWAVRCDPDTVLQAAVAAQSHSIMAACWQRPSPAVAAATASLLDRGYAGVPWARLCVAAGGPSSPAQWSVCFQHLLGEALCEAASRVDPARLAAELPRAPELLLRVARLSGSCCDALLATVAALGISRATHRPAVAALLHLVALRSGGRPSLLRLLTPLFAHLSAAANGAVVAQLRGEPAQEDEDEPEDEEDGGMGKTPYEAALARLTRGPRLKSSQYESCCRRLAQLCAAAALQDPQLRAWQRAQLAAIGLPSSAAQLLDAALLFQLCAGCVVDDVGTDKVAALQAHLVALQQPPSNALSRCLVQLYALCLSMLETWEEASSLSPLVLGIVDRALRAPHPSPVSSFAARDFAASATLRMRHLLPLMPGPPPPAAPPRLVAGWLALLLQHRRLQQPQAPLALSWTYAAVAADALRSDMVELVPLMRLDSDGNLDAALVLRVCGLTVPFDFWKAVPPNETAAARLVEVTGKFEPALAFFPESTAILGAALASCTNVPQGLLCRAVCCDDLSVQAAGVALLLKKLPLAPEFGGAVTASLLRQVSAPHSTLAIKLLHKINLQAKWAYLMALPIKGVVLSTDLAVFEKSLRHAT